MRYGDQIHNHLSWLLYCKIFTEQKFVTTLINTKKTVYQLTERSEDLAIPLSKISSEFPICNEIMLKDTTNSYRHMEFDPL